MEGEEMTPLLPRVPQTSEGREAKPNLQSTTQRQGRDASQPPLEGGREQLGTGGRRVPHVVGWPDLTLESGVGGPLARPPRRSALVVRVVSEWRGPSKVQGEEKEWTWWHLVDLVAAVLSRVPRLGACAARSSVVDLPSVVFLLLLTNGLPGLGTQNAAGKDDPRHLEKVPTVAAKARHLNTHAGLACKWWITTIHQDP